jgi:hypothetical protein
VPISAEHSLIEATVQSKVQNHKQDLQKYVSKNVGTDWPLTIQLQP